MRKTLNALLVVLLSLAIFASAHTRSALAQTNPGNQKISVRTVPANDIAILRRLRAIYHEIDGLSTVDVQVSSGVVKLRGTVADTQLVQEAELLSKRVEGVVAVTNGLQEEMSIEERLTPVLERLLTRLQESIRYIPLLGLAFVMWGAFILLGWLFTSRSWPWSRIAPNIFIADLLKQLVWILFIVVGALLALDIVGAATLIGTVLGAAGIVGLAVGFAVRDTVEN